jgi:multidrug efflux pump subunit AcrA (membrane-fusion protein)
VYVNVPQNYVPSIKIGAKAVITVPEYPTHSFEVTVEASAQSVDVASGTTRMQLGLDNASGELMPGSYANVKLTLQRDSTPLNIPASALIFNRNGLRVATVGPGDRILFKQVAISRDLGRTIELASGLAPDDRVVVTPPDGISDGDQVRIAGEAAEDKPAKVSEKQDVKG